MSFSKSSQNGCFLLGLFVFLFAVCIFSQTQADIPDMMINSDGTSEIHNMSQIWVSPNDSNVVMIVWRDFHLGYRRVGLGVSYDEGHTWLDSLLTVPSNCRHSDPIIRGDRLGNAYPMTMVFNRWGSNYYDFNIWETTNNGASWSGPFFVLDDTTGYEEDREFLAIDRTGGIYDGNMYVAWSRFPNPTTMMFTRSTTGGVSWEDPLVLAGPDTSGLPAGYYAFPLVDADGNVYVIWMSHLEIGGEYYGCEKMVKSTDGGQNFTEPEVIFMINYVNQAPGLIRIYNAVSPDADITNGPYRGNIYLAVPNGIDEEYNSPSDIIFVKSTDGGDSWSTPIRVNDDPEGPPVYQFHPWLVVNEEGVIIIFFYDQRNDPPLYEKFDSYIAFSFDGGETFTSNFRVSDVSSDPEYGLAGSKTTDLPHGADQGFISALGSESSQDMVLCNYIGVAAYYDQVHCTWTDTRDGNQNVYYSNFGIPLLPPRLHLPEDEGCQLTLYPTFKWAACGHFDEVTYDLEISTDSTFATVDFEYADVDTNIFTVSTPLDEVEYFWRAKAHRIPDDTVSDYSEVWSFTVDVTAPDVPTLLSPDDSSIVTAFSPDFRWTEESKGSPVFYTLQVADDSLFPPGPEFYEYSDIYDTSFALPETLTDSTVYYWRTKAKDEAGHESAWQKRPFQFTAIHFIVGDATGDGVIDVADVMSLINYLFIEGSAPDPLEAGDANCDGAVDIADVMYLINYLFIEGPPPDC
jgi:hypothetical protein